jgi:hypothetical protein
LNQPIFTMNAGWQRPLSSGQIAVPYAAKAPKNSFEMACFGGQLEGSPFRPLGPHRELFDAQPAHRTAMVAAPSTFGNLLAVQ